MKKFDPFILKSSGIAVGTLAIAATSALAGDIEVIYTKISTHPTSIVPGALDLAGDPAVTNIRALEDLYMSPDGTRWVIKGRTQQGADLETILLIGSGASGTMFMQEGQPTPGSVGELNDSFGSGGGRFNENNEFALSLRARGGSNTQFQKVILYTGGLTPAPADFTLLARGGNSPGVDLYTGLVDLSPNPSGDETIGNSIGSVHVLNNLVIGVQDSTINNVHSSRRPAIFYSNAATPGGGLVTFDSFQQAGVDTFLDTDGITPRTYGTTLSANTFYTTPDGSRWLVHGQILGAPTTADNVLIVDGQAQLKEGSVVPGGSAEIHSFVTTDLIASGDWFARGLRRVEGASNGAWAARNGVHIAQTGDPIGSPFGPSENWGASFYTFTGNSNGDWVLIGKSDNADPAIDDVVVLNGEVVMREGDPVDLDGNGQFDDDVFIGRGNNTLSAFEPNDAYLSDDMMLYLFITIRNGAGVDLNSDPAFGTPQAFVRIDLAPKTPACPADLAPPGGDGAVGVPDLLFIINNWGPCPADPDPCPADIAPPGGDDAVGVPDLLAIINAWGPCPE